LGAPVRGQQDHDCGDQQSGAHHRLGSVRRCARTTVLFTT
jgi:hypothetical protein